MANRQRKAMRYLLLVVKPIRTASKSDPTNRLLFSRSIQGFHYTKLSFSEVSFHFFHFILFQFCLCLFFVLLFSIYLVSPVHTEHHLPSVWSYDADPYLPSHWLLTDHLTAELTTMSALPRRANGQSAVRKLIFCCQSAVRKLMFCLSVSSQEN